MNFKRIGISLAALFLSACASTVKYKPEITDECLIRDHQSVRFDEKCGEQKFEQAEARIREAEAAALAKVEAEKQRAAMEILAASAIREMESGVHDHAFSLKLLAALTNADPNIKKLAEETSTTLGVDPESLRQHIESVERLRETKKAIENCKWVGNAYECNIK